MRIMSIDLETLDTRSTAVVLAIGWCILDMSNGVILSSGSVMLRRTLQAEHGRTIDPEGTLSFWLVHREAAALNFPMEGELSSSLQHPLDGLGILADLWWDHKVDYAVGFSAAFDLGILESLAQSFRTRVPWGHKNALCLRTLSVLNPGVPREPSAVPHSSESNAVAQAIYFRNLLGALS